MDTNNFVPKCHPASHLLKIKSSSKLTFLTHCILTALIKENSSSPLEAFWEWFFSGHPSPALCLWALPRVFPIVPLVGIPPEQNPRKSRPTPNVRFPFGSVQSKKIFNLT
ncbi:hypothetical protein DMR_10010 [Solidesulfovibrio magneticus RS-1]|uniref:Uncharacterized protein n=1 Tax=Solidesulfovibrio magneticus (strain ATCC 700980 / DSM 13731 / RS-1) TaxID=573370 RepID=C4XKV3_SOLM1|nr:hypothetical protein DMR_10010 [Solidesulfovibrio magneticus RS-1]